MPREWARFHRFAASITSVDIVDLDFRMSPSSWNTLFKHLSRHNRPLLPRLESATVSIQHANHAKLLACLVGPALTSLRLHYAPRESGDPDSTAAEHSALDFFFKRLSWTKPALKNLELDLGSYSPPPAPLVTLLSRASLQSFSWRSLSIRGLNLGRYLFNAVVLAQPATNLSSVRFIDVLDAMLRELNGLSRLDATDSLSSLGDRMVLSFDSLQSACLAEGQFARLLRSSASFPQLHSLELHVPVSPDFIRNELGLGTLLSNVASSCPRLRRLTISSLQISETMPNCSTRVRFPFEDLASLSCLQSFSLVNSLQAFQPFSDEDAGRITAWWPGLAEFSWIENSHLPGGSQPLQWSTLTALAGFARLPLLRILQLPICPSADAPDHYEAHAFRGDSRLHRDCVLHLDIRNLGTANHSAFTTAVQATAVALLGVAPIGVELARWLDRSPGQPLEAFWEAVIAYSKSLS